jgi:hypothetical protein
MMRIFAEMIKMTFLIRTRRFVTELDREKILGEIYLVDYHSICGD